MGSGSKYGKWFADNRKMTFACDLPPFGLDVVDMKMLALTDGFDNLPDIGAVLEDGIADIQILESDLVPDRNIIENLERNGLVLFHDPASQFLTGLHAFHGDDADAVAVFMNQKLH